MNLNVEISALLQQYSFIPVCDIKLPEDSMLFKKNLINFHHFFLIRDIYIGSNYSVNLTKALYAEISELSRKGINCLVCSKT